MKWARRLDMASIPRFDSAAAHDRRIGIVGEHEETDMDTATHDREGYPSGGAETMTQGYAELRDMWAMDDHDHDPWGTAMGHAFPAAEVLYVRTGELVDGFRPAPHLYGMRADSRAGGAVEWEDETSTRMWEMIDTCADDIARAAIIDDLRAWSAWLAVECQMLTAEERDY